MNNRVFGNYIGHCLGAISTQSMIYGPIYLFRNIMERVAADYTASGSFAKTGPGGAWQANMEYHHAMEYWFNNTLLNRDAVGGAYGFRAIAGPKPNVVIMNNIIECSSAGVYAINQDSSNIDNIDYNICNKTISPSTSNVNGTTNTSFSSFYNMLSYWNSTTGEASAFMNSNSDGYNQGVKINNFTTFFDSGMYPDIGAMDHEKTII